MKKTGFYIIKDKFFEDIPDPYLKENKAGNRPGECISDTGYVSDYRGIHRTRIYNRWKSSDADE